MMKTLPLVVSVIAGCSGAAANAVPVAAPVASAPAQPAAQPDPDPLEAALAAAGFTCSKGTTGARCVGADRWPLVVTAAPSLDGIVFHSFEDRAADKTCGDVRAEVDKLASTSDAFFVRCDDGDRRFDFQTYVSGNPDNDFASSLQSHLAHRTSALEMLKTVNAIRVASR